MALERTFQRVAVCERFVMGKPITSLHFPWKNVEVSYRIVPEDLLVKTTQFCLSKSEYIL
jgi:hypothetical protein